MAHNTESWKDKNVSFSCTCKTSQLDLKERFFQRNSPKALLRKAETLFESPMLLRSNLKERFFQRNSSRSDKLRKGALRASSRSDKLRKGARFESHLLWRPSRLVLHMNALFFNKDGTVSSTFP